MMSFYSSLSLSFSLTYSSIHRREQHTCSNYYKMSNQFGGKNSRKDVYIDLIFAHGFDEFVTTRPPSTNSTTIKNDEK